MKRTEPKSVAQIIDEAINSAGLTTVMAEQKACYLWEEIVGPGINRYTSRRYVDKGVMHVYITSASLKNELSFLRTNIVEQLNRACGANVITTLIIH